MGNICERVRSQVSLELDGELSQLERAMVERHLGRCTACAAFESRLAAVTSTIRRAPLEHPEHRVVVRRPPRRIGARLQTAAVAAVALVSVGISGQLAVPNHAPSFPVGTGLRYPSAAELDRERLMVERASLFAVAGQGTRDTVR